MALNIQCKAIGNQSEGGGDSRVDFARQRLIIGIGCLITNHTGAIFVFGDDGEYCCSNGGELYIISGVAQVSGIEEAGAARAFGE